MNGLRVSWINSQRGMLRQLDALAALLGRGPRLAGHLATGLRGEREALFELRRMGYTVVARRWKNAKLRGDVDLIGWDGEWLCFIEVKTRTQRDAAPAEVAVDRDSRRCCRRWRGPICGRFRRGFVGRYRCGSMSSRYTCSHLERSLRCTRGRSDGRDICTGNGSGETRSS